MSAKHWMTLPAPSNANEDTVAIQHAAYEPMGLEYSISVLNLASVNGNVMIKCNAIFLSCNRFSKV